MVHTHLVRENAVHIHVAAYSALDASEAALLLMMQSIPILLHYQYHYQYQYVTGVGYA